MPWKVDPATEQRLAPIHAIRTAGLSVAEAARRYGISRKAAHQWPARHDADPDAPNRGHPTTGPRPPTASPRPPSAIDHPPSAP